MKKLLLALPLLLLPASLTLASANRAEAEPRTNHFRRHTPESLSFEPFASNAGILGINYVIGTHGYPVISDIYKSSPADKAGLRSGDEILAVDEEDTRYIGYLHLQPLLAGDNGKQVMLKIKKADGSEHALTITRASVESFKDPNLQKCGMAHWRGSADTTKNEVFKPSDHLIDLPFALLSREHNRPTLFEFTENEKDSGVQDLLKKHSDGSYILAHCKVVRITKDDPGYEALTKYLAVTGSYSLIPVYRPWLVTVKDSEVITALPTEQQLDEIAKNLVHNSIKVQVSHAVTKQKGDPEAGEKLNKRAGLAHKTVIKRIYQALPAEDGIAGIGFGVGDDDDFVKVTQVFANGPAARAGLKEGDCIFAIDSHLTAYDGLEHIQASLTGPIGHSVNLSICPKGAARNVSTAKTVVLKLEALPDFKDPSLSKMMVPVWKHVISSNPDDSDEFELPCCMLARAKERPTIFEFRQSADTPGIKATIDKMREEKKLPAGAQDLQVVSFVSPDPKYEMLRKHLNIKSTYACLPVYSRDKHKTFKSNQIIENLPSTDKDMDLLAVEKLLPEQLVESKNDKTNTTH